MMEKLKNIDAVNISDTEDEGSKQKKITFAP